MRASRGLSGLVLLLSSASAPAIAQDAITIERGAGFNELAQATGTDLDALEAQLREEVAALYGALEVRKYLELSANAQNLVSTQNAADYASTPKGFFLGLGVASALSVSEDDLASAQVDVERNVPTSGGAMVSVMLGYNLADLGIPRLTLSAHGMHLPSVSVGQLEGTFSNVGFRAQFLLVGPTGGSGFEGARWGGLALTSGYTYARTSLTLVDDYEATTALNDAVDLDTLSTGTLELAQVAHTIPIELTTHITLVEFLTLYGGAAIDIPLGDASATMDLDTVLSTDLAGQAVEVGDARILVEDGVRANDVLYRFMAGVQVNIWKLGVYGQLAYQPDATTLAGSAGLKIRFD